MSPDDCVSRVDPLDPEPETPPESPGTPIGGSTTSGGRTHPTLAHLPERVARAAVLTLTEAAIAHVEGRPWPAHHVERRFLRRCQRWRAIGDLAEARQIVRRLASLPPPVRTVEGPRQRRATPQRHALSPRARRAGR